MKKLLLGLALAVTVFAAQAQNVVVTNLSTLSSHALLSSPARITGIQILGNIGTTNGILRLYDWFSGDLVTTNTTAFTNYTLIRTNQVETYINAQGMTNTFTNSVMKSFPVVVAASTNVAVVPFHTRAVPYGTVTDMGQVYRVGSGLVVSNTAQMTLIVEYTDY